MSVTSRLWAPLDPKSVQRACQRCSGGRGGALADADPEVERAAVLLEVHLPRTAAQTGGVVYPRRKAEALRALRKPCEDLVGAARLARVGQHSARRALFRDPGKARSGITRRPAKREVSESKSVDGLSSGAQRAIACTPGARIREDDPVPLERGERLSRARWAGEKHGHRGCATRESEREWQLHALTTVSPPFKVRSPKRLATGARGELRPRGERSIRRPLSARANAARSRGAVSPLVS